MPKGIPRSENPEMYRERPIGDASPSEAQREGLTMGDTRDPNVKVMQERVRVPVNSGQLLALRGYELDPDYHHYWIYDNPTRPGRVEAYKAAFYEHCVRGDGSIIEAPSGAGKQYLMRLHNKYYAEDVKAAKDKRAAMRRRDNKLGANEYTVDSRGRPVEDGEVIVKRSVSDNPYA